jgi:hypothetical protein
MTTQKAPADTSPATGTKPPLQARLVAVTLADQAGRAFSASQAARSAS